MLLIMETLFVFTAFIYSSEFCRVSEWNRYSTGPKDVKIVTSLCRRRERTGEGEVGCVMKRVKMRYVGIGSEFRGCFWFIWSQLEPDGCEKMCRKHKIRLCAHCTDKCRHTDYSPVLSKVAQCLRHHLSPGFTAPDPKRRLKTGL